jgi:hypothetical protein
MLFTRVSPHTKSKGLPIGGPSLRKKLMLFICVAPHTKSKGLRRSLVIKKERKKEREREKHAFYTHSTAYKKQGAPDRRPTHPLLLSEHALSRTKSNGLHRYVLQISYFINQVPEVFAAQLVSSSLCLIHTISHQIPIGGAIYFSYIAVINIREVRDIYLYLSKSSSSSMQKKKIIEPWGCRCHRTQQD